MTCCVFCLRVPSSSLLLLLLLAAVAGCCASVCCSVGVPAVPPLTHAQQVRGKGVTLTLLQGLIIGSLLQWCHVCCCPDI